ncbi:MAG: EFR1 family ferrodoxin [Eubacterium sp.]|nr:EFR1 family ferrodoxin [Eubacterium sp.]
MVGIYFSGTGNSRYILECFCNEYDPATKVYSIEDAQTASAVKQAKLIAFSYPVQYSTVPKIVRDYISEHKEIWDGKYVFVIATQGLFSGDGAGMLTRELEKYGAKVIGGLHAKMPDSIGDVKLLKHPLEKNKETIRRSEEKARKAARFLKERKARKEGIGFLPRMAGLFGQRLYFGHMTKEYSKNLKIDPEKCVGCGVCAKLCPMKNISVEEGKAVPHDRCAMCYRCINRCPQRAITLLGKEVVDQSVIEKYI